MAFILRSRGILTHISAWSLRGVDAQTSFWMGTARYSPRLDTMFFQHCSPTSTMTRVKATEQEGRGFRGPGARWAPVGPGGRHAQEPGASMSMGANPGALPPAPGEVGERLGVKRWLLKGSACLDGSASCPPELPRRRSPPLAPLRAPTHVRNGCSRGPPRPRHLRADLGTPPVSREGLCLGPNALGLR